MTFDELMTKHGLDSSCGGVGDGWVPVLDSLITDLTAMGWDKNLQQVKEKFGGLRFYVGACSDEMLTRIDRAEIDCDGLCEDCGAEGEIRSKQRFWIRTLCDTCDTKDLARYTSPGHAADV